MNNKKLILIILGIFLIGILPSVSSVGEINFCCEKTIYGAWCQNEPEENCNLNFRKVPTSCEATSFCKLGCCYDSQEGTCMENSPEAVCNKNRGVYSRDSSSCDIPQCSLGCCLIGEQAAFVTQTRCKRLSSLYGLEINFRTDISNEMQCIASATSDVKGACVFEEDYETTCKLITQKECKELEGDIDNGNVKFHADYLCSAEQLGTNCGPTIKTTCVEGEDEVYFVDSCGNLANIYDSDKQGDKEYWSKIYNEEESCGFLDDEGSAGSSTCGNCDYYSGSTCKKYDKNKDRVKPAYGNFICRDLECKYEGETYEHGETWCVSNTKSGDNFPGSEDFRLVCYNGDITIEPCAAWRAEKCIQEKVNNFKVAACRVNRWQDCVAQDNEKDCDNEDKRDCEWIYSGNIVYNEDEEKLEEAFVCVPKDAPGFDFWNEETESGDVCSIASAECVAKFEKGILADTWKCKENCHCCIDDKDHEGCTGEGYEEYKDEMCESLGDCGAKKNYIGVRGYNYDEEALKII